MPRGKRLDGAQIGALDLRVVKVVEVVERPDRVARVEQSLANMRADEARAAGDEKIHGAKLATRTQAVEDGA